ncbi:hypothetical protein [Rhodospira trueperi]|uniref:Flagellar motor protein MotB n=1 Tax=Rhodospira trueperi TaxID=69960 RepID=A0A1G7A6P4_9PROT|nr:hypothetical protein [Rhodospira trueperi]SDE10499.1 Flagellar motor protein MotB [Rhodospira trueperi]
MSPWDRPAAAPAHPRRDLFAPLGSSDGSGATRSDVVTPVARGSLALFLSLYLLLLAFFIMLTALSSLESLRVRAVIDSLTLTFATAKAPDERAGGRPFQDLPGDTRAAEAFIALVSDLFQSAIPTIRIEQILPGREMELLLRTDSLFETDTTVIRPARLPMLDGVVAALAGAPEGQRFEMAATLQTGTGDDVPETVTVPLLPVSGEDLPTRRAGELGRVMTARGAAPGSVLVGLAEGDANWMRITFRAVDAARWSPDFTRTPSDAVPIDESVPSDATPPTQNRLEDTQGGAPSDEENGRVRAESLAPNSTRATMDAPAIDTRIVPDAPERMEQ